MRRRRSLERQTVRSVPIGRPCNERSLASCVQTVAWRSRISQRGRRKHPSQIALGAHRATFGHWLNLFHGGSRDHRSARCYRQSKCTSLRQPCAPTAIGEGGFCSGLFITHLLPLDGVGSAVPSLQLHPVFGIDTERVPPNDAMSRFVGFGDKSWDNLKNFFQTQGFEFLFLSQSARRVAFGGSMAPKTPVLKLNRPFARKPPAAIASELTRVACAPFAKPQVAGLRHS